MSEEHPVIPTRQSAGSLMRQMLLQELTIGKGPIGQMDMLSIIANAADWLDEAVAENATTTLTDAERDALLDAAEVCDSRERRSIEFRLPQEAEHWRCLAATIRGLSERLSGTQEKCTSEECHK